jgi:[ribosomal protein S5]-alanine N-acetyltransferase
MLQTIFQPFPELITERLLLRQLHLTDAPELFFLRSNKDVMKYVSREPATSMDEVKSFIKSITQTVKQGEGIFWAIALRNNPATVIGNIGIWQIQKENRRAEIGYVLHPDYWGQKMITEALHKATHFAFNKMKLHSLEARIDPNNIGSAKVLLATGFVKEGYFKEDIFFRGKYIDTEVYSKLGV